MEYQNIHVHVAPMMLNVVVFLAWCVTVLAVNFATKEVKFGYWEGYIF